MHDAFLEKHEIKTKNRVFPRITCLLTPCIFISFFSFALLPHAFHVCVELPRQCFPSKAQFSREKDATKATCLLVLLMKMQETNQKKCDDDCNATNRKNFTTTVNVINKNQKRTKKIMTTQQQQHEMFQETHHQQHRMQQTTI